MKTYQKPEVDILDVMTEEMIAASGAIEEGFNIEEVGTTDATSGNLARELFFFED
jgi:hypothetical protein